MMREFPARQWKRQ